MQDLISHCLQYESRERPTAQNVFDRLCSAEFVGLKRAIPIERDHSVETFTIRVRREPVSFRDQMSIQVLFQTHPQYGGCSDNDYMYGSLNLCCTLDIPSLIPSLSQLGTRLSPLETRFSLLETRLFPLETRLGYPTVVSITVSCL